MTSPGTALARLGERTLPHLPAVLDRPLAVAIGGIVYRISAEARANVRENLAIVAPERSPVERERLVRAVLI